MVEKTGLPNLSANKYYYYNKQNILTITLVEQTGFPNFLANKHLFYFLFSEQIYIKNNFSRKQVFLTF